MCCEDCPGGMACSNEGHHGIGRPWGTACPQYTGCRRHGEAAFVLLPPHGKVARVQSYLKASEQLWLPKKGMS